MKRKNLFTSSAEVEILERVSQLCADSPARWGTMNATEMLYHCNLSNHQALTDRSPYVKPSVIIRIKKVIVFQLLPHIPRNNKGPARTHTVGKISREQFDVESTTFKALIHRLVHDRHTIQSIHPALGFLTDKEWGRILWMHMDHHLRQFGV